METRGNTLALVAITLMTAAATVVAADYLTYPNLWRGSQFYQVGAVVYPALLAAAARVGPPWAATITTSLGTLLALVFLSAVAGSTNALVDGAGAVQNRPPVMLGPALLADLLVRRSRRASPKPRLNSRLLLPLGLGVAFVPLAVLTHWPMAGAILARGAAAASPASFPPLSVQWWNLDPDRTSLALRMAAAVAVATVSAAAGTLAVAASPAGRTTSPVAHATSRPVRSPRR